MPRISTDNYDTVASWNGSQDLFVVEQPDGTKVATPAMVKQFIEAGDFEATGEVKDGHGNILKDMAKSAIIGDLSQTGLTGDSVAAQLATARGDIADINTALLPIDAVVKRFYINNGNKTLDTGINVNQVYSTGFIAIVSTHETYNRGQANIYIGGVAYRKQDGTVGGLNVTRLGGVGLGDGTELDNIQFEIVNDKLQLKTYQYRIGASVTLILSKR